MHAVLQSTLDVEIPQKPNVFKSVSYCILCSYIWPYGLRELHT